MQSGDSKQISMSRVVNNYTFGVSLVFTVIFWYLIGGSMLWGSLFALTGIGIDLSKKIQIDAANSSKDGRERRKRYAIALVFTAVSLLGSLGAALARASSVTNMEEVLYDTTLIDQRLDMEMKNYNIQIEAVARLPWNAYTERGKIQAEIDKGKAEISKLSLEKRRAELESAAEDTSEVAMFKSMAKFFRIGDYRQFMVILLMFAAIALEIGYWTTVPEPEKVGKFSRFPPADPIDTTSAFVKEEGPQTAPIRPEAPKKPSAKRDDLF